MKNITVLEGPYVFGLKQYSKNKLIDTKKDRKKRKIN
jgi:hypothetical protein